MKKIDVKKSKFAFCSSKITQEIEQSIKNIGITPIKIALPSKDGEIRDEVAYHPDMLCFNLYKDMWLFYEDIYEKNREKIDNLHLGIIKIKRPQANKYPHNIELNAAVVGNNLFCFEKYTNNIILSELKKRKNINIINVKQGYAKCSICIADENSIITADKNIYYSALQHKIDALLIKEGGIELSGYNYGFIGGCSGLAERGRLVFFGNVDRHKNSSEIKLFCKERNVEIISLSNSDLYDYGGLLPIF